MQQLPSNPRHFKFIIVGFDFRFNLAQNKWDVTYLYNKFANESLQPIELYGGANLISFINNGRKLILISDDTLYQIYYTIDLAREDNLKALSSMPPSFNFQRDKNSIPASDPDNSLIFPHSSPSNFVLSTNVSKFVQSFALKHTSKLAFIIGRGIREVLQKDINFTKKWSDHKLIYSDPHGDLISMLVPFFVSGLITSQISYDKNIVQNFSTDLKLTFDLEGEKDLIAKIYALGDFDISQNRKDELINNRNTNDLTLNNIISDIIPSKENAKFNYENADLGVNSKNSKRPPSNLTIEDRLKIINNYYKNDFIYRVFSKKYFDIWKNSIDEFSEMLRLGTFTILCLSKLINSLEGYDEVINYFFGNHDTWLFEMDKYKNFIFSNFSFFHLTNTSTKNTISLGRDNSNFFTTKDLLAFKILRIGGIPFFLAHGIPNFKDYRKVFNLSYNFSLVKGEKFYLDQLLSIVKTLKNAPSPHKFINDFWLPARANPEELDENLNLLFTSISQLNNIEDSVVNLNDNIIFILGHSPFFELLKTEKLSSLQLNQNRDQIANYVIAFRDKSLDNTTFSFTVNGKTLNNSQDIYMHVFGADSFNNSLTNRLTSNITKINNLYPFVFIIYHKFNWLDSTPPTSSPSINSISQPFSSKIVKSSLLYFDDFDVSKGIPNYEKDFTGGSSKKSISIGLTIAIIILLIVLIVIVVTNEKRNQKLYSLWKAKALTKS